MATQDELRKHPTTQLQRGTRVIIECLRPPIHNVKENILLTEDGEREAVYLSGYWEGLLDQGRIRIVDALSFDPVDPETPPQLTRKGTHRRSCRCAACGLKRREDRGDWTPSDAA